MNESEVKCYVLYETIKWQRGWQRGYKRSLQ